MWAVVTGVRVVGWRGGRVGVPALAACATCCFAYAQELSGICSQADEDAWCNSKVLA